ncbi:MAG TPA: tetratricopeptide repeat protein [Flavipsychrobacter sp.]|nr:tetratricopeptide repeat protein [Flavipsychrobacter sp.]
MVKKSLYILILSIFLLNTVKAQTVIKELWDKAHIYHQTGQFDSAFALYDLITQKFPSHPAYPLVLTEMGSVAYQLRQYDTAIRVFKTILEGNFKDDIVDTDGIRLGAFPNYNHYSAKYLVSIYIELQKFDLALSYLQMADQIYTYKSACGNDGASNSIQLAVQYSKCYEGLNQIDSAISVLGRYVFDNSYADNLPAVEQMYHVLQKKFTRQEIVDELKKAKFTITRGTADKKWESRDFQITLFGKQYDLPDVDDNLPPELYNNPKTNKLTTKERAKLFYTTSAFYKKIIQ